MSPRPSTTNGIFGDLNHWVRFFLQGATETATKGRDTFSKVLSLRTDVEQRILTLGRRASNARQVLNVLYRKPFVSAADLEQALAVSSPTAQSLLKEMARLSILTEVTGQVRGRLYVFQPYLHLFLS